MCTYVYKKIKPIEKALGYKIIIIVKRTAAPFDLLFCVCVLNGVYLYATLGILWILKIALLKLCIIWRGFCCNLCYLQSSLPCLLCLPSTCNAFFSLVVALFQSNFSVCISDTISCFFFLNENHFIVVQII